MGYFSMNELAEPELAIPYFVRAIEAVPPDNPFPQQLGAELRAKDRPDLAEKIELLGLTRRRAAVWAQDGVKCPKPHTILVSQTVARLLCRLEEHKSELQSIMRISDAIFCLH